MLFAKFIPEVKIMTDSTVLNLGSEALRVFLMVAGPLLAVGLLVGLLISILQATTQIQEQTLVFVPKLLAVGLTLMALSPWMTQVMSSYVRSLVDGMANVLR